MRGLQALTGDDQEFFGPGTDLVLSLVALLVLVVFALNADLRQVPRRDPKTDLDIESVRKAQMAVIRALAGTFGTEPVAMASGEYGIRTDPWSSPDIIVENEATLQRIRFGSHVLFETDEYDLQPRGEVVLRSFARALEGQLDKLEEIHLQGHADTQPTTRYPSNLVLAAWRAIAVLQFLQAQGIDPTRHLMSATSFGEYDPVTRRKGGIFGPELLAAANDTEEERALNRRIEVILIYALHRERPASLGGRPTK